MTDELAVVADKKVLAMLTEDPTYGTEDMGESGGLPMLKITSSMSKENILTNGNMATVGRIYHTELKQEFDELEVNFTYVGQFELPDYVTQEPKMTYVLGGVLKSDNSPFIMFAKGFSLQNMWSFSGEITNIRNRFKLPMYCLNVTLGTAKRPHDKYKTVDVWNWKIQRDENTAPVIEQDPGRISFLKDSVAIFKDKVKQIIKAEDNNDVYIDQHNKEVSEAEKALGVK